MKKEIPIEYEAMFSNIDKDSFKKNLEAMGAKLIHERFLQKRETFELPIEEKGKWLRIRKESDKTTLTLKQIGSGGIDSQREIEIAVSDFELTISLLNNISAHKLTYGENYRTKYELENVEIVIDEWPYLEALVEIEGSSEEEVKRITEKIGLNWGDAIFDTVVGLYMKKYGVSHELVCNTDLSFNSSNPFEK